MTSFIVLGVDPDTKQPTVGLKLDYQSDFAISVKPGDEFKQFPDSMKKIVQVRKYDRYRHLCGLLSLLSSLVIQT